MTRNRVLLLFAYCGKTIRSGVKGVRSPCKLILLKVKSNLLDLQKAIDVWKLIKKGVRFMAHLKAFGRSAVGQIITHNCRTMRTHEQGRKFSNDNIDPSKTIKNYSLIINSNLLKGKEKYDCILNRDDVYVPTRKDLNTLCSIVITLPKDYDGHAYDFFSNCKDVLDKMIGGAQWCVDAQVHNDETTPHMHYMFVPVVPNKDKDKPKTKAYGCDYKVSSKALCTRQFLRDLHPTLERELRAKEPNRTINILTDETREKGNISAKQLQQKERARRLEEREKALQEKEQLVIKREKAADKRLENAERTLTGGKSFVREQLIKGYTESQEIAFLQGFYTFLEKNCKITDYRQQQHFANVFLQYKQDYEKQHQSREREHTHKRDLPSGRE